MSQLPPGVHLWKIPFAQAPPGSTTDFNRRSDLLNLTIALISILLFLTTSICILRVWVHWRSHEFRKLDDGCVIAATIITTACGIMMIPYTERVGKNGWDIPIGLIVGEWFHRMVAMLALVASCAIVLAKACVLTLYFRIFGHSTSVRYQIYALAVLMAPVLIIGVAMFASMVPPPGKAWGVLREDSNIFHVGPLVSACFNLVVDVLILCISVPVVLRTNLARKDKAVVLAVFLTGSIAIIANIVAMYYRVELLKPQQSGSFRKSVIVALCGFIEAALSVIVSSTPAVAKVWKRNIVGSKIYIFVQSKLFKGEPESTPGPSLPSDIEKAKADVEARKRRRNPFSLPTWLTTNPSPTQSGTINQDEERCEPRENRQGDDIKINKATCSERFQGSSLKLHDPSGFMNGPRPIQ